MEVAARRTVNASSPSPAAPSRDRSETSQRRNNSPSPCVWQLCAQDWREKTKRGQAVGSFSRRKCFGGGYPPPPPPPERENTHTQLVFNASPPRTCWWTEHGDSWRILALFSSVLTGKPRRKCSLAPPCFCFYISPQRAKSLFSPLVRSRWALWKA